MDLNADVFEHCAAEHKRQRQASVLFRGAFFFTTF
jgi:hypothetical protein